MAYTPYNPYQSPFYPVQMPQQVPQQAQQQQVGLSPTSRPVGNREEANSVPADFSGAFMVFPDITHDRVYIKRWNYQTGTADFIEYARVAPSVPQEQPKQVSPVFATVEDLEGVKGQLNALRAEVAKMHEGAPVEVTTPKKGAKKDE